MHYQGFKYDEIAEELDIPLGTVKSRIFSHGKLRNRCGDVSVGSVAELLN